MIRTKGNYPAGNHHIQQYALIFQTTAKYRIISLVNQMLIEV